VQDNHRQPVKKKPRVTPPMEPAESVLESAGEVIVEHYAKPPKGPPDKQIHPRRRLPQVPDSSKEPKRND
jgi:hypothetical protein